MDSKEKYIPPHRRKHYTDHAEQRMEQSGIIRENVEKTLQLGVVERDHHTNTYRDANIFSVVSKEDKSVITVMPNYRNTKFDCLNKSIHQAKQLQNKIDRGNDRAMCDLAELHLDGTLGKVDVEKAHNLFLQAARKNNSHAMCKLAELYESGQLGEKNPDVAFEWKIKAADRGNKYALAIVGQHYMTEYSKCQDENLLEKAYNYLYQSSQKGSTRAMWSIGYIYQRKGEIETAKSWFEKAAKLGSPASLNSLSDMVKAGNFDEHTLEGILDEISTIVGRNSSELAVDLGLKQIDGELGKNPMRGILMLEAAAENNNDRALSALFKCYRDGRGPIEIDKDKAQIWYTRLKLIWTQASEQGNIEAIWGLGELCLDDTFESTDIVRAEELFLKVIESNIPEYLHKLGIYYRKGVFGEDSKPLGEHYIKRAEKLWTEQGGEFFIGKIYYDGDLGESDFAEAKKWFEKCSDIDAIYYLAKIYLHEQDYNNAKDNLLKLIPYSPGFAEEIKELLGEMPSPSDWIMPLANQDTLLLGIVQDLDIGLDCE